MTAFERVQVNTSSGSGIAVYRAGSAGPGIFFLGGLQAKSAMETPVAPVLLAAAQAGARVSMMDLTGSGNSFFRREFTLDLLLDDVCETCRGLDVGRSIWIGASLGAWLMLLAHRRNPAWFQSMCALAPAVDWDESFVLPGGREGEVNYTRESRSLGVMAIPASLVKSMPAHRVLGTSFPLGAPLHILHGTDDDIAPPGVSGRLAAQLGAQCTLELLEGGDHGVAKLATAASAARLAGWLREEMRRASEPRQADAPKMAK